MDLISDIVRLLDTRLIYKKSMLFYVLAKNNWNLKIFKKTHNGTKKKKALKYNSNNTYIGSIYGKPQNS